MTKRETYEFLKLLDPSDDARFNIETYADGPAGRKSERPKPDPLMKKFTGLTLTEVMELFPELQKLNKCGAGIFVAVNECNGRRSKANISRIRGVHADLDGLSPEQFDTLLTTLEPTIRVRSSRDEKQHWYWLTKEGEEMPRGTAEAMNKVLVSFGADKAATDISRLLRLPGFHHMKNFKGGMNNA